jgi:hypothetical protein
MNSQKKGTGSEVNITLTMIWYSWSICAHFRVVQSGFLRNFDIDNCLLNNFHSYTRTYRNISATVKFDMGLLTLFSLCLVEELNFQHKNTFVFSKQNL